MKNLFTLLLLIAACYTTYAQTNLNNQVNVYFRTGVSRVPPANTTASISSSNVLNVLNTYSIPTANVVPTFPSFNEADTVHYEIGESSRQMNRGKVFTITITNPATKTNLINALNALSEVLYAESNGYANHNIIPVDGRFNDQWGLRNTLFPGRDIHAEQAWDIFTGNPNAIIAIIDDGVDRNHNDLNTKMLGGDNGFVIAVDNLGRQFSHGSHVAGIAAAITNNAGNNGVAGVDWRARIHPKNIFDGNGDGDITQSIFDAVNFGTNVWTLNHSWGLAQGEDAFGVPIPGRYSVTVRAAFAHAYRNNRVSCVAMGNHQTVQGIPANRYANNVAFPAGYNTGIIAVGATNNNDNIAGFSANGPHIDVAAPGVGIWSTNFNNNYIDIGGTSMATPHVAGLASLLKGFNQNLFNDDIEQIIRLSADDVNAAGGFPGFDNQMGTGRINAQRALQLLQAPNTIQHLNVTGGTIQNTTGDMTRVLLGVPGLPDGTYVVRRVEVRRNITFPAMCNLIGVWGRGIGTTGLREENGRSYGEGICEVVPGTLTNTSATLRTWIYQVWNILGQPLGFFPRAANNVIFQYTILGAPVPNQISGDNIFCTGQSNNYTIPNLPAGAGITWSTIPASGIVNINTPNAPQTRLTKVTNGVITLRATLTNACGQTLVINKHNVVVGTPTPSGISGPGQDICYTRDETGWGEFFVVGAVPSLTYQWQINGQNAGTGTSLWVESVHWGIGTHQIRVRSHSAACGYSPWYTSSFIVKNCGGPRFRVFPNPASSNITVDVDTRDIKTTELPSIQEVELVDKMGAIKYRQKQANGISSLSIPVSNLPADIYTVRIFDGKKWHSFKVSVRH